MGKTKEVQSYFKFSSTHFSTKNGLHSDIQLKIPKVGRDGTKKIGHIQAPVPIVFKNM